MLKALKNSNISEMRHYRGVLVQVFVTDTEKIRRVLGSNLILALHVALVCGPG